MDVWSCSHQVDGDKCLLLYPTPQAWNRMSTSNISYCIPKCTESSPRVLGFAYQDDSSMLFSPAVGAQSSPEAIWMRGSFFSLFTEGQASFKADFPWFSGRWMGHRRAAAEMQRCCTTLPVPCNSLWALGSSCLPPAVHHKTIVTACPKLNSLPKLFLGKRAAKEEGLQNQRNRIHHGIKSCLSGKVL